MSTAQRAYGFARVSALKSRLMTRDEVMTLRCTTDARSSARSLESLGLDSDEKRFAKLMRRYQTVLRAYPEAAPIVRAMLQIHEVENLKIAWRAISQRIEPARWHPLLRDLSSVVHYEAAALREASSLFDLVQSLEGTNLHGVAHQVYAAHGNDLAAAELAFDRWASFEILRSVEHLGARESLARDIAVEVVHERDDEIVSRGVESYGLSPAAVDAARVLSRSTVKRHELIHLCRRAFVGQHLRLAPAIAFIVFSERDYRLASALAERDGDKDLDGVVGPIAARSASG